MIEIIRQNPIASILVIVIIGVYILEFFRNKIKNRKSKNKKP